MEFPNLGSNCSVSTCRLLDFLPVQCDGCNKLFCLNHMKYKNHDCPNPKLIDNQVPVCPLCNQPVPSKRTEPPDIAVSAHIDRDCQSDPAKDRRKIFTNKCSVKNCKKKELIPIMCNTCNLNYCLTHRHPSDHNCKENTRNREVRKPSQKETKSSRKTNFTKIQGNMTEDEALAHAMALSMQGVTGQSGQDSNKFQSEDEALAQALAASVQGTSRQSGRERGFWSQSRNHRSTQTNSQSNSDSNCSIF